MVGGGGGRTSDSGDRAGVGAGDKQTPHPRTRRCLKVSVVNLISFSVNSQPNPSCGGLGPLKRGCV